MPYFDQLDKNADVKQVLEDAVRILNAVGMPISDQTTRRLERMAMAFLAVIDVKCSDEFSTAKVAGEGWALTTRQIIDYCNQHFQENTSSGSYDDIRRKDLKFLVLGHVVVASANNPSANNNNPTRGYSLSEVYADIVRNFHSADWEQQVERFMESREVLRETLAQPRDVPLVEVTLPGEVTLSLSQGNHNELQKAIIEQFLPRFGERAEVLYFGDSINRHLYQNDSKLAELGFFEVADAALPDVIAYSETKNWLFVIEAVHSSGAVSSDRKLLIDRQTEECTADIVYVTAYLEKATFKRDVCDIAWETEVWIAEVPDHMIHFNGGKFLGPYTED